MTCQEYATMKMTDATMSGQYVSWRQRSSVMPEL